MKSLGRAQRSVLPESVLSACNRTTTSLHETRMVIVTVLLMVMVVPALPVRGEPASFVMPKDNSKKFFPISLWSGYPPRPDDPPDYSDRMQARMQNMADADMNLVVLWMGSSGSASSIQNVIDTLDAAEAAGMYVMVRLHEFVRYHDWPDRSDELETYIDAIEDHNALFCYDTADESELTGMATLSDLVAMKNWVKLKDAYGRYVRNNQSDIVQMEYGCGDPSCLPLKDFTDTTYPVAQKLCDPYWVDPDCRRDIFAGWTPAGDVFSMDIYAVGNPVHEANLTLNSVSAGFNIQKNDILAGMGEPPQYFILQGASLYDMLNGSHSTDRPTKAETRFMAFDLMTQGCKGIEWFGTNHLTETDDFWLDIVTIAGELSVLGDIVAAGTTISSSATNGCHVICKEYNGRKHLIVTNPSESAQNNVSISATGLSGPLEVLFDDKPFILVTSGSFADDFVGWGARAYAEVVLEISIDLDTTDDENGLVRVDWPDGSTEAVTMAGRVCRKNLSPGAGDHYIYLDVDGTFVWKGNHSDVCVTVDYFDAGSGTLDLEYDSSDAGASPSPKYKRITGPELSGTNTWKTHRFHMTDAYFGGRQNGNADMRLAHSVEETGVFYLDVVKMFRRAPADFDCDGDVDQEDFGHFQACLTGSGEAQDNSACADARLDADEDVDTVDFARFLDCLSGPGIIAAMNCADAG